LNHCVVLNTCDEVDNATIVSVDTERVVAEMDGVDCCGKTEHHHRIQHIRV
jgi:hypothetical protein